MHKQDTYLFDKSKHSIRYQDFSDKPEEPLKSELYQYAEASRAIDNYTEAIALFGTRRLGKTVTLNQLWDKYHTNNSIYLKILENATMDSIVDYVKSKYPVDFLFIDEITNILALDVVAADLLDCCKAYNIKVIATGTTSYLLSVAFNESACGRFRVISFNPPNIQDLANIRSISIDEFMLGKNTFYMGKNYLDDISRDILKAIEYLGNYKREPLFPLDFEELKRNIEIIMELLILTKTSKLPRDGLVFSKKYYKNLDMDEVMYRTQSKKEIVYYVYNILNNLQLLIQFPVVSFDERTNIFKLYLTTPALYAGLLNKYDKEALSTKMGFLFECVAVCQIFQIFQFKERFKLYTFRDEEAQLEYDLVIEDSVTNTVYLNKIKNSSSKYGKYKNNTLIESYYATSTVEYIDINPSNLFNTLDFYKSIQQSEKR